MRHSRVLPAVGLVCTLLAAAPAAMAGLDDELGRSEDRVLGRPFAIRPGLAVQAARLPDRLDALGYVRVRHRPDRPGTYFWGHDIFWIFRQAHRVAGDDRKAVLIGLDLRRRDGVIEGIRLLREPRDAPDQGRLVSSTWLEPAMLAESLEADRAARVLVSLAELPERVWRPVLAAEDERFLEHAGVDGRGVARALLTNVRAGRTEQGGSTITQQLIKNRDLTPKRTWTRKLSEAVRALALEAEYDKEEILQAYLNRTYFGHVNGLAVHGLGTAARVYFSKDAGELTLGEAATLAGIIRSPNRLSPIRHPQDATARRDRVLERMAALQWASAGDVDAARRAAVHPRPAALSRPPAARFLASVAGETRRRHGKWLDRDRGVVVETALDGFLQDASTKLVRDHLAELRRRDARLRDGDLAAALVALDATDGRVVVSVGGDPGHPDRLDRVTEARRQPGSAIKPLLLTEALEDCGGQPLHLASRVADEPLTVDLPAGDWSPTNADGRFRGVVTVRQALVDSINVPFVRITRHCGETATARRLRRAGLTVPDEPPPSFALGALEATPLQMAAAYTLFAGNGVAMRPVIIDRIERSSGRRLSRTRPDGRRVTGAATAWLVDELMRDAVRRGTGEQAALPGTDVAGKTGTSSDRRDAWFVGRAGGLVAAVWLGRDSGDPLGLGGGEAAAPLWRAFMQIAVGSYPGTPPPRPRAIEAERVDPRTGLRVSGWSRRGREEFFRRGALPPRRTLLRRPDPEPVVR